MSVWLSKVPFGVVAVCFVALVIAWLCALLQTPETVIALRAQTEVMRVNVTNADAAAFVLRGASLDDDPACLPALTVSPARGAEIVYARSGNGALTVSVSGRVHWASPEEALGSSDRGVRFTLSPASDCVAPARVRLPANGLLDVGRELSYASDPAIPDLLLTEGVIRIYGRAFGTGWLPSPFGDGSLYQADEVAILPGSRVSNATADKDDPLAWRGFVTVEMDPGAFGMTVDASTNAQWVRLYAPTSPSRLSRSASQHDADDLSLVLLARVVGDPNLRLVYAVLGALASFATLAGLLLRKET